MNADLPQLRVLRYAPLPTMLSSIHSSFFPLDFPPSFTPLRLGTLPHLFAQLISLAGIGPCFAFIYPLRVPRFPPSPPFFCHSLQKCDTIHSPGSPFFLFSLLLPSSGSQRQSRGLGLRKREAKPDFHRTVRAVLVILSNC